MAVESAADRAAFVNPDEFGLAATYTLAAGGASTVNGVFSEEIAEGTASNKSLATAVPAFLCRTADLPSGAKAGDRLTVAGRQLRVLALHDPGATGMTEIHLG